MTTIENCISYPGLSIRQPWAKLILTGKKSIETRTWNTNFRGVFIIHASKSFDMESLELFNFKLNELCVGVLIGKGEIYDVFKFQSYEHFINEKGHHLLPLEWYNSNLYGFRIKIIEKFDTPIPYKGKLGFFEIKIQ